MRYADGNPAQTGDKVEYDGGKAVGYVTEVVDTPEKMAALGVDQSGVAIQPKGYEGLNFLYYPEWAIEHDGMVLISRAQGA
jgi:hypothetical protein